MKNYLFKLLFMTFIRMCIKLCKNPQMKETCNDYILRSFETRNIIFIASAISIKHP